MVASALLSLNKVELVGGHAPLHDISFTVNPFDRWIVFGRNGAGKSTFLRAIAGLGRGASAVETFSGNLAFSPHLKIATLPQILPDFTSYETPLEVVMSVGSEAYEAEALLESLDIDPYYTLDGLSGGQIRRVSLAQTLAQSADLILLDEPTNHLDIPTISWLELEIIRQRKAFLITSHDRAFLSRVGTGMAWVRHSTLLTRKAPFSTFPTWVEEIEATEQGEQDRLHQQIKAEERYALKGVTARRKRNQRRVAKLVQLRQEKRQWLAKGMGKIQGVSIEESRSGKRIIEARDITLSLGGKCLFKDFSIRIIRGDRLGIVGPNGSGKTTLIKTLLGSLSPDKGEIERGANLDVAWLDQKREALNQNETAFDFIGEGTDTVSFGGVNKHVLSYLGDWLFDAKRARSKIKILSGGEQARLLFAKIFLTPVNVLVMDEPTNDLDIETLELLEEKLASYQGTLITISHDRAFLDETVTSLLSFEGNGQVEEWVGGYTDYQEQKKRIDSVPMLETQGVGKNTEKSQGHSGKNKPKIKKLSYKLQREYDGLPDKMDSLAQNIKTFEKQLEDQTLFQKSPDVFANTTKALTQAQKDLEKGEERWLELEMMTEQTKG